jgi:hypothetical protein
MKATPWPREGPRPFEGEGDPWLRRGRCRARTRRGCPRRPLEGEDDLLASQEKVHGPNQAQLKTTASLKVKTTPLGSQEKVQDPNQALLQTAAP